MYVVQIFKRYPTKKYVLCCEKSKQQQKRDAHEDFIVLGRGEGWWTGGRSHLRCVLVKRQNGDCNDEKKKQALEVALFKRRHALLTCPRGWVLCFWFSSLRYFEVTIWSSWRPKTIVALCVVLPLQQDDSRPLSLLKTSNGALRIYRLGPADEAPTFFSFRSTLRKVVAPFACSTNGHHKKLP